MSHPCTAKLLIKTVKVKLHGAGLFNRGQGMYHPLCQQCFSV